MKRWVPTIWLGFVVIRYGMTTLKTLRAPLSSGGLELEWCAAWIGFMLLVSISALLFKPPFINRLWLTLTLGAAVTGLVLSQTLASAVIAAAIIAIAGGLGEFVLQRLAATPTGMLERVAVTVPVGIGFIALGQLAIALAGFFSPVSSWLLMLLFAIPAVYGLRRIWRLPLEKGLADDPLLVVPLGWIFILNLMWTMAPEIHYDALSTHLAVPRIYLERGGIVDLPYFFHSYFVHLLDMVFGLCLALDGPIAAKFLVLSLGVIAAGGVFALGRTLFNAEAGAWSALIFYSTPLVMWLSGTAYIDLAEACFIVAAILSFLRWWETSGLGWLLASGWVAGVAVGTKVHALTILGALPVALVWRVRKLAPVALVRTVFVYSLTLALAAAPWYAVIYAFTGNPVYPFMNAIFRSPGWNFENTSLDAGHFGIGTSLSSLIRLPFWFTWDSGRFGEGLPQGGVGVALLLAFPLAAVFLLPRRPDQDGPRPRSDMIGILLACAGLHLALWAFSFQYGRYYVPVLPLVAVLGAGVFFASPQADASWRRCLLFVAILAQVPVASVMFWNIPERFPLRHALGRESAESLLSRGLPGYRGAAYINSVIQPGEKVLGEGAENLRFYLSAPLYTLAETSRGHELLKLAATKPDAALAAALAGSDFAYIIAPLTDVKSPEPYYTYLQPDFIRRFTAPAYRDESVIVLKICATICQ